MQIKIQSTEEVWATPDRKKVIRKVLTADGQVFKTYSDAIGTAAPGAEFDVEVYEKQGNRGPEKFVKQIQKAYDKPGAVYGGGQQPQAPWTSREIGMRIGCAMNNAVNLACHGRIEIGSIDNTMAQLYHAMDKLEKDLNKAPSETAPTLEDVVAALKADGVYEQARAANVSKTDIVALIGKGIKLSEIVADIKKSLEKPADDLPM